MLGKERELFEGWSVEQLMEVYRNYAVKFAKRKQSQYPIIIDEELVEIIDSALWGVCNDPSISEKIRGYRLKSRIAGSVRRQAKRKTKENGK